MRLFGKPNSLIDRFDRAEWITPPFDLSLSIPVSSSSSSISAAEAGTTEVNEYQTIFRALTARLKTNTTLDLIFSSSGFIQEHTKLPYLSVNSLGHSLGWKDTTKFRFEETAYAFIIYAEQLEELLRLIDQVEELFDGYILNLKSPLGFENLQWLSRRISELEPGLYQAIIIYEIIVDRITNR